MTGMKNTIYIACRHRKLRRIVFDYEPSWGKLFDIMMSRGVRTIYYIILYYYYYYILLLTIPTRHSLHRLNGILSMIYYQPLRRGEKVSTTACSAVAGQ